jgi:hypothetical protein
MFWGSCRKLTWPEYGKGPACGTLGEKRKACRLVVEKNLKERGNFEDIGKDGIIILKRALKK